MTEKTLKITASSMSFEGSSEKHHNLLKKPHQVKLEQSRSCREQEQSTLQAVNFTENKVFAHKPFK